MERFGVVVKYSNELIAKLKSYYPNLECDSDSEIDNALFCVVSGFRKNFAKNLKRVRATLQMSQTSAAGALNITFSSFNAWENGRAVPRISKLKEISDVYKIDLSELIDFNPVSPEAIFRRDVPLIEISFFKAKSFSTAVRDFGLTKYEERYETDKTGAYDFAIKIEDNGMEGDRRSLPHNSVALCAWQDFLGEDKLQQLKKASGHVCLLSIAYNTVLFREIHFDGTFLHLRSWNESCPEMIFPLDPADVSRLNKPELAEFQGHLTVADSVQIFAIVKKAVIDL